MSRRLVAWFLAIAASGVLALAVPATALADPAAVPARVDRVMRDPRITESSGLAVSPGHAGVLWTHNDSGNPPLLYALAPSGAVVGTVRIPGVPNVDWEGMAAFRDARGAAYLAAGDIGDNGAQRSAVEVDVVPEPARLGEVSGQPRLRLRLRYPDGARDAETLVVDTARRRLFVVSKGLFSSTVYVVPTSAWDGNVPARPTVRDATLVAVGTVPLVLVTDGTVGPGGVVLLRTYGQLAALDPFPTEPGRRPLLPRETADLPDEQQGEGLALDPDGRSVLLSSEGTDQPVLRFALPETFLALLTPASPAVSPSPSGGSGSGSGAASAASASGLSDAGRAGSGLPGVAVVSGAVVILFVALAAAVAVVAVRHQRHGTGR